MKVKLYTLNEQEVWMEDYATYITTFIPKEDVIHTYVDGEPKTLLGESIALKDLPIKKVLVNGVVGYYSFDPDILKLLSLDVNELKRENIEIKKNLRETTQENTKLKNNLLEETYLNNRLKEAYSERSEMLWFFNTMSFFQRLVFLFTGKAKFDKNCKCEKLG